MLLSAGVSDCGRKSYSTEGSVATKAARAAHNRCIISRDGTAHGVAVQRLLLIRDILIGRFTFGLLTPHINLQEPVARLVAKDGCL